MQSFASGKTLSLLAPYLLVGFCVTDKLHAQAPADFAVTSAAATASNDLSADFSGSASLSPTCAEDCQSAAGRQLTSRPSLSRSMGTLTQAQAQRYSMTNASSIVSGNIAAQLATPNSSSMLEHPSASKSPASPAVGTSPLSATVGKSPSGTSTFNAPHPAYGLGTGLTHGFGSAAMSTNQFVGNLSARSSHSLNYKTKRRKTAKLLADSSMHSDREKSGKSSSKKSDADSQNKQP